MHYVLKRLVDSSIGGFSRMVVRIHSAIQTQLKNIQNSMEQSYVKKPLKFTRMKPRVGKIFSRLYTILILLIHVLLETLCTNLFSIFVGCTTRYRIQHSGICTISIWG